MMDTATYFVIARCFAAGVYPNVHDDGDDGEAEGIDLHGRTDNMRSMMSCRQTRANKEMSTFLKTIIRVSVAAALMSCSMWR